MVTSSVKIDQTDKRDSDHLVEVKSHQKIELPSIDASCSMGSILINTKTTTGYDQARSSTEDD